MRNILYLVITLLTIQLTSCKPDKKDDPAPVVVTPDPVDTTKKDTVVVKPKGPTSVSDIIEVSNLQAGRKAIYGGTTEGHYTLFSFKENAIIPIEDSASTKWDIGFKETTIIVNGGTSGPGTTSAQIVINSFDDLADAPATGYKQDNSAAVAKTAIPTGSNNGWYNYNATTHIITAIAGRTIVVKTSDNKYVKMRIVHYYKDKVLPTPPLSENVDSGERYYSFRYAYQSDGSTKLK